MRSPALLFTVPEFAKAGRAALKAAATPTGESSAAGESVPLPEETETAEVEVAPPTSANLQPLGAPTAEGSARAERAAATAAAKSPAPNVSAAAAAARTSSGSRKQMGPLGALLSQQRSERVALAAARPTRHGNFGGAFRVHTVFGTQHVAHSLNASGEAAIAPTQAKRRTARGKMPMSAPIAPRKDAKSEKVVRDVVSTLLQGPFNALVSTIVKDLEGYAFGSTAFNASKVLMQVPRASLPAPPPAPHHAPPLSPSSVLALPPPFRRV